MNELIQIETREHVIAPAVAGAEGPLLIVGLRNGNDPPRTNPVPHLLRQAVRVRQIVQEQNLADIPERPHEIIPLALWELWRLAHQALINGVRPKKNGYFSKLGGFVKKPDMRRT